MTRSVVVMGGGLAGLTAAARLAERGYALTLVEEQERLGGRLLQTTPVLFGCDEATHALRRSLRPQAAGPDRETGRLEVALPEGRPSLRRPWLPGLLHGMLGLGLLGALPMADRWRALDLIERIWEGASALPSDLDADTADAWLARQRQSEPARARWWNPLARFLLGGDLTTVSAAALIRAVARHLLSTRRASRITIPAGSPEETFITPLADRLRKAGADIRLNTPVARLQFTGDRVASIQLEGGAVLTAQWYVLSLPHHKVCSLLPERLLTRFTYFEQLTRLTDAPSVVVRLWLDPGDLRRRLVLLPHHTFHWMVLAHDPRAGLTAPSVTLVAADCPSLLHRSDQTLYEHALADVKALCASNADATCTKYDIVRDPRAFLRLRPGASMLRPLPQSPIANLVLAGGWTDTGLPSSMESAVVSGLRCVTAITAQEG